MHADSRLMKKINQKMLREILQKYQSMTKPKLAAATGLSVVTVNTLIKELMRRQEVIEDGVIPSEGGRPSKQYRYNYEFCYAAVVYSYQKQEGNFFACLVLDLSGKRVWRKEQYGKEIKIESFIGILDEAFQDYPKIRMLIFGLPGEAIGKTVTLSDYKKLVGKAFFSYYEGRYGVPVIFENDINAMVYGYFSSVCQGKKDGVVGLYFPRKYPPGAGIIVNGQIYCGTDHFAGELEKLPVPIPWDKLNYEDDDEVLRELKYTIKIFCYTLAPAKFILYGDFFRSTLIGKMQEFAKEFSKDNFKIEIKVTDQMEKDYEEGLIRLVLSSLKIQIDDLEELR